MHPYNIFHWYWFDKFYFLILTYPYILGINSIWSVTLFFCMLLHYTKYFISALHLYFYVKGVYRFILQCVFVACWFWVYINFIKRIVTLSVFFSTICNNLNSVRIMCSLKVWKNLPIKHLGTAPFMEAALRDWFLFLPWIAVYSDCQIW